MRTLRRHSDSQAARRSLGRIALVGFLAAGFAFSRFGSLAVRGTSSPPAQGPWTGQAARVSVSEPAIQATASSQWPALSADGRFVVFVSAATNLVPGDTNNVPDVFVRDRQTGTTARVSLATGGAEANGGSAEPAISADGRYVAFASTASNLAPGTGAGPNIFVHDRATGQTEWVSQSSEGAAGNAASTEPAISPDGRYVSFTSLASNLVPNDTNDKPDVFVRDRESGETTRVSVATGGGEALGTSGWSAISSDGHHVAFLSSAPNLVADDTNDKWDVFVRDRVTGSTSRVNVASDGTQANDGSGPAVESQPAISADGRFVAFASAASNLTADDANNATDIFVRDRQTFDTTRISRSTAGVPGDGPSRRAALSAEGRYVAFVSDATNLVAGDTAGMTDIFVHDREAHATVRVNLAGDGTEATSPSTLPAISGDGRFVAFGSDASNLVAGDTNGVGDIFVVGGLSVTPASQNLSAAGGAGTVDVSFVYPDTPWSAVSQDGWITVESQSGTSGTGSVSYAVQSNGGLARVGTLMIAGRTVIVNQAVAEIPLAAQDGAANTSEDAPVSGTLRASAPAGQPLTFTIVANGTLGRATIDNASSGLFTYTPLPDAFGTDHFTFKVNDGTADSNVATVTVTIAPENDAPIASNSSLAATEDVPASAALVATDVDSPVLTYRLVTNGTKGQALLTNPATGAFTYTPSPNANGIDSFTFAVTDDTLVWSVATVTVTIAPVNDPPVARSGVATASTGAPVNGALIATDVDGDALTYRIVTAPTLGTLDLNAVTGTFLYTANPGAGGYEAIAFEATDPAGASSVAIEHLFVVAASPYWPGQTVRGNVSSSGAQANRESEQPASSADGRYVAFASLASNLVASDTNNTRDIFVRDRQTGQTTRVSVAGGGAQANNASMSPAMSADGRYVAFVSLASNLVTGDTNGAWDVFVHDRDTKQTTRVNLASDGTPAEEWSSSDAPALSADGRYVAFTSSAANLVPGDTNGADDVFVHDRQTGRTERVSTSDDGTQANRGSLRTALSADGRFVAFTSSATNLVTADTNEADDIFVFDRETRQVVCASVASDGTPGNDWSQQPALSADGRYVTFASFASSLVPGDTNGTADVFVRDRITRQTERVSLAGGATEAGGWSEQPTISADGRYVAFMSSAPDLAPNDTNGAWDIFVRDRQTHRTTRVSLDGSGAQANGWSDQPALSADGRFVTFRANATSLVPGDTNGRADIFVAGGVSVTPAGQSFPARGGTGAATVVFVYGSTPWSATSQAPWITITGQNSGTVSYSVARNTEGARSGTLTVATQVIAVAQDVNHAPAAADRTMETDENAPIVDHLRASDVDGDPLSFVLLSTGTLGTATLTDAATGAFTYIPRPNANGTDTLTFQANDGFIDSNVATVTLTIKPVNYAPVAADSALATQENVAQPGSLGATDADNDALTFTIVANGTLGTAALVNSSTGAFVYTPNTNAGGIDRFTFKANDGSVDSNVATVTVTIAPVNTAPVALDGTLAATEDIAATGLLVASDVDGPTISYSVVTNGSKGLAVLTNPATGAYKYTPNANAFGTDTFTFSASDGTLSSNVATVTVTIAPVNDAPIARSLVLTGSSTSVSAYLPVTDVDYDQLSYRIVSGPTHGVLSYLSPYYSWFFYLANPGASGYDSFTFEVQDPDGLSSTGVVHLFIVASTPQWPGQMVRGNLSSTASQANHDSEQATLSADGRYVVFTSAASNLVPGDTNGVQDIFVRDRQTGLTTRVSLASDGAQAAGDSFSPVISPDGRYVAFVSSASNLVPGDTNDADDLFLHDRDTQQTTRVNVASDGVQAENWSSTDSPAISADGRFVAFTSTASNLVPGDTNDSDDVFVRDRTTGQTVRISVTSDGTQADGGSRRPSLSADGQIVAFTSSASNLVAGDTNGVDDVFLLERETGQIVRVSQAYYYGTSADAWSDQAAVSADGRYVVFASFASNLVYGDTNGTSDVFLFDRFSRWIQRVSLGSAGTEANGWSEQPSISADGRYVAFLSLASNLVDGDTNGAWEIYVRDAQTGQATRVSATGGDTRANGWSDQPAVSADGRFVAFRSGATNLVADDTNGRADIFIAGGLSVTPRSSTFTARGGSGTVDVSVAYSTAPWTATSQAPWITITGQTAGQLSYDVAPNRGADRIGTLTVASQVVTITQFENHAPFAWDSNIYTSENLISSGWLYAWDQDFADPLTYSVVTNGTLGTLTITNAATGEYRYTPRPNVYGTDSVTFKVNDGFKDSNVATITVTIQKSPLPYSQGPDLGTYSVGEVQIPLAATGGTGPYAWYSYSTLPQGLALRTDLASWFPASATAGIIGVATVPGTYTFRLAVTSDGLWSYQDATLKITALTVGDTYSVPDGFVGKPYAFALTALNNNGPVTWTATANRPLPAGLSLGTDGVLSGTPAEPGRYTIDFSLADAVDTVYRSVTIDISAIEITTDGTLPNGSQGEAYAATISARGGSGNYTFTAANPPPGLVLNPSSGELSGTITGGRGPWSFTVTATDNLNPALSYARQMSTDIVDTPPSLPSLFGNFADCTIGVPCLRNVAVGSGVAPFSWTVSGLPPGMRVRWGAGISNYFHASDLEISGTPTAQGQHDVVVTVTDAAGKKASKVFPLHVSVLLQTDWLSDGTIQVPYSKKVRVIGGVWYGYYFTTLTGSQLPVGLSADTGNLVVSGTPAESGYGFHADFRFSDWWGNSLQTQNYFSIAGGGGSGGGASPVNINMDGDLGTITLGSFYSRTLSACCASSYGWSHIGGTLPPGISLSADGLLSGLATSAGTYTFLIQVADAANSANYAVRQFTAIVTPISITTNRSLPPGNVASPYQGPLGGLMLTATGGFGLTWNLAPGASLPPGMTLYWNGFLAGTPTSSGLFFFAVKVTDTVGNVATSNFEIAIYPEGVSPPPSIMSGPNLGTYSLGEVQISLTANGGDGTYAWTLASGALPPGVSLRTDFPMWFPTVASGGLIGIATTEGAYTFRLGVTSAGQTTYRDFTLKVTRLVVKDQYQVPDGFTGRQYQHSLTALNNTGPVTWAATSPLPPGMSLGSDGVLSGTPAARGSYDLQYTLTDATGTLYRSLGILVSDIEIPVDGVLPNATQGVPYSTTLTARGGSGLFTFSAPGLPFGFTLNPSSGVLSAPAPTSVGPWQFTVTATDIMNMSLSYTKRVSIDVISVPPTLPAINPYGNGLDDCTVGVVCNRGFNVYLGGRAPFTWFAEGLPAGMSIRWISGTTSNWIGAGDGEIWGTATEPGEYIVRITARGADGTSVTNAYPLRVSVLEHVCCLAGGTFNVPYSQTLRVLGGSGTYSATQAGGQLPSGLLLDSAAHRLSGTPLEGGAYFNPVFRFADSEGRVLKTAESLFISAGGPFSVSINTGSNLGTVFVGSGYTNTLSACCMGPYEWTVVGGTLPPGLSLSTSGVLTGTTTTANTYQFLVRATSVMNPVNYGQRQFTLVVTSLSITSGLPIGNVGTLYNAGLTAVGGSAPLTWTLAPSNYLPPGLTLAADGTISGTPTDSGQFVFTINVTDAAGRIASRVVAVSIYPAGVYPPLNFIFGPALGPFTVGTLQFQLTGATGGLPPYRYSITPGANEIPGMRVQDGQPLPTNFGPAITAGYIGVITTPGTYTTSLRVTDSLGNTFDRPITVTVTALNILSQSTLPPATVATPYTFGFTPSGGSGTYSWFAFGLQAGLSLNSSTGVLSGMAGTAGTFTFSVFLIDTVTFSSIQRSFTLVVSPFAITPGGVLPQATVGAPYNQALTAPGCGPVCSWFMFAGSGGSLPAGLSINSSTGVISGSPTAVFSSFFTVQASGSGGTTQRVFSLPVVSNVAQPLSIVTGSSLGFQTVGNQLGTPLIAQGGLRPYTWSLVSGTLPPGVSLQTPGETVGGFFGPGLTYLAGWATQTGTYTFTLRVDDNAGGFATRTFTWNISALSNQYFTLPVSIGGPPVVTNPLKYNVPYVQSLLAIGGTGRYTWAASGLPTGLTLDPATGVVSGTPLNTGTFTVPIQVTDDAGNMTAANITLAIAGPTPVAINFSAGPNFTTGRGSTFSTSLNIFGGTGPYIVTALTPLPPGFTVQSGTSLLSNGTPGISYFLAGTPLATGVFSFTLEAKDSAGNVGARTFTLTVVPVTLFTSSALADASVARPYAQTLVAWAGSGTVTWSVAPGSTLPPGLSLSSAGVISGTPMSVGNSNFTLNASDVPGSSVSFVFSVRVLSFDIADAQLLPLVATVGVPFTYTFTAIGGTASKAWLASGLPAGVTLSPTGTLSGVITTNTNVLTFFVTLSDSAASIFRRFTLFAQLTNPLPLSVAPASTALPDTTVGQSVSYALTATGGTPPYAWSLAPGSTLPPGLNLMDVSVFGSPLPQNFSPGSTILAGAATAPGQYVFDLIVGDFAGFEVRRTFTLNVSAIAILTGAPRGATVGTAYAQQFTAVGGKSPYSFSMSPTSVTTEMLPPGLTLSPEGLVFGTPASTGLYSFLLRVTDSAGNGFARSYSIFVSSPSGFLVTSTNPPDTWVGSGRRIHTLGTNGLSTYTWSLVAGNLPPGLALAPGTIAGGAATTTVLAGAPTSPGLYTYTLRASDNAGPAFADHVFTYRVSPMQVISPPVEILGNAGTLDLPGAHVGVPYSFAIKVTGGVAPYQFTESPFAPLPRGLTLGPDGVLAGTPESGGLYSVAPIITDSTGQAVNALSMTLVVAQAGAPFPLVAVANATTPARLVDGSAGVPYRQALDPGSSPVTLARGGVAPYTWTVAPGSDLPPGMTIVPGSDGVPASLGGVPTTPGSFNFSLVVLDGSGQSLTLPVTATVSGLALSPDSLAPGVVGAPYAVSLVPSGGTAPYTIQTTGTSDMPPGLTLSADGLLSGVPAYPGNFLLTLIVSDGGPDSVVKVYTITIDSAAR